MKYNITIALQNTRNRVTTPQTDRGKNGSRKTEYRIRKLQSIVQELYQIWCTFSNNMQLANDSSTEGNERMNFSILQNRLFGREKEKIVLQDAYERMLVNLDEGKGCSPELVLLRGASGTGKTSLAETVQSTVIEDGGFFICGKFDRLPTFEPFPAFESAFSDLIGQISDIGGFTISNIREEINSNIRTHGRLLIDMIPSLGRIVGETWSENEILHEELQNRHMVVFSLFLRAICKYQPIILFLDDIQWADKSSMELLQALATDNESSGLMLIVAMQDDMDNDESLTSIYPWLQSGGEWHTNITEIAIDNLSQDIINEMLSLVFEIAPSTTQELAKLISSRTQGNSFHVVQFLEYHCNKGHDQPVKKWDAEKIIRQVDFTKNHIPLEEKFRALSRDALEALQVGACIGSWFPTSIVKQVMRFDNLDKELQAAVNHGLVEAGEGGYCFLHDQIRDFALPPESARNAVHLTVGRFLSEEVLGTTDNTEEYLVFLAVEQLNRGSTMVTYQDEKNAIAFLNMKAASDSLAKCAFASAAFYAKQGINLLASDSWQNRSQLTHLLYSVAAEGEYGICNYDAAVKYSKECLKNAKSFGETRRPYLTLIRSLGCQNKLQEAIDTGIEILEKVGETFPAKITDAHLGKEFAKTVWMLRRTSDAAILKLPVMTHKNKLFAMQILHVLFPYTYLSRISFTPFVVFRMVQISMKYGLCAISSFGFACYGMILAGVMEDIVQGHRFGHLGIMLVQKFNARHWMPRVYAIVYGCVNHWKDRGSLCLHPLLNAHKTAMEIGDVESAMTTANLYIVNCFDAGVPLCRQEMESRKFYNLMKLLKQDLSLLMIRPRLQFILNLKGCAKNPLVLTGEVMNQEDTLRLASVLQMPALVTSINYIRMHLAFLFGYHSVAACLAEKNSDIYSAAFATAITRSHCFLEALNFVALARSDETTKKENIAHAKANHERLQKWKKSSKKQFCPLVSLVEAEIISVTDKPKRAATFYQSSIQALRLDNCIHTEALAHELAGNFYHLVANNQPAAREHALQAYDMYIKWGADAKAEQLKRKTPFLATKRSVSIESTVTVGTVFSD